MKIAMRGAVRVGVTVAAATWLGCGGGGGDGEAAGGAHTLPEVTHSVSIARPITAPSDRALMVFLCPAECEPFAIVDGSGAIVAQIATHDRALVDVAPGTVTFYALAGDNGDRIAGEVTAGGVYYAAISAHGAMPHFATISPRSADGRWDHVAEYLADTEETEIDPEQRATLDEQIVTPQLRPRMTQLDTRAGEMDAAHQDERTIHAEDGAVTPPQP
jgi:hypothetical protein